MTVDSCYFSNIVYSSLFTSPIGFIMATKADLIVSNSIFDQIYTDYGVFLSKGSHTIIDNCTFTNSISSIYSEGNSTEITNCTFNSIQDGIIPSIYLKNQNFVSISECSFSECSSNAGGAIIMTASKNVTMESVTVSKLLFIYFSFD